MSGKLGRYQISAEFSLETRIEPEGVRFDRFTSADGFSDDSYFSEADVEVYGGSVSFIVEAESVEDAEAKAEDVIADGMEVEDDMGFTWTVAGLNVTVEELEAPEDEAPSVAEALAVIQELLLRLAAEGKITEAEAAAFQVVLAALDKVAKQEVAADAEDLSDSRYH